MTRFDSTVEGQDNALGVQLLMGQVARWFERGPTSAAVSK